MHYPPKPIYHDTAAKLWFLPQMPKVEKTELEIKSLLEEDFFDVVCIASHRQQSLDAFARLYNTHKFPPIVFVDEGDDPHIRHDSRRVTRWRCTLNATMSGRWEVHGKTSGDSLPLFGEQATL